VIGCVSRMPLPRTHPRLPEENGFLLRSPDRKPAEEQGARRLIPYVTLLALVLQSVTIAQAERDTLGPAVSEGGQGRSPGELPDGAINPPATAPIWEFANRSVQCSTHNSSGQHGFGSRMLYATGYRIRSVAGALIYT
jgi:hypothetical protein